MSYVATWFKGADIVAVEEFDDLFEAQAMVLQRMALYQETIGADKVRVGNGRAVLFQVENNEHSAR